MPDQDIRTGRYYEVQTEAGKKVLYLKMKKSARITGNGKPEYTFYSDDKGTGGAVLITSEEAVLRDLGTTAPAVEVEEDEEEQDEPATDFGPYAQDTDPLFWKARPPSKSLAKRLGTLPDLIAKGLEDKLDPSIWEDINQALEDQQDEAVPVSRSGPSVSASAPRTRRASKVALKGEELGKVFVEAHPPKEISGTTPLIEAAGQKIVTTRVPRVAAPSSAAKKPGYVLNIPAHVSKDVDGILEKYGEQATKGLAGGKGRIAAVVAVNDRKPLEPTDKVEKKVESTRKDQGFDYGVVGFYWAPQFGDNETFAEVKKQYDELGDEKAQEYVQKNLYKGRSRQEDLPYGLFREQATLSEVNDHMLGEVGKRYDPVYIHVGDPDAVSWTVNNDEDTGVLARYDEVLGEIGKDDAPYPPLITGGYNFGETTPDDSATTRLVKLGNFAERALRRTIAPVVPEALYPTEPNLLVKASDTRDEDPEQMRKLFRGARGKGPGSLFGKGASEGNTLRLNLARELGRETSDPTFAPYVDATVETDIPDRILASARAHPRTPVLNLLKQKQSYLTAENWTSISRTNKPQTDAKATVEAAIRKLVEAKLEEASGEAVDEESAVTFEEWQERVRALLNQQHGPTGEEQFAEWQNNLSELLKELSGSTDHL